MRAPSRSRAPRVALSWLVALVCAATVAGCGSADDRSAGAPAAESRSSEVLGVAETKALLDGVTQRGFYLGDPKAPVTLLEYVDLQCPYCKQHQLDVQPTLIKELVRTGQAQLAFVPLAFLGEDSVKARNVLLRLARKNRAWEFANLFYANQGQENSGYVTQAFLDGLVAATPDAEPADASVKADPEDATIARAADALGQAVLTKHEAGTPSFAVGKTGGTPADYRWISIYQGESPADQLVDAVRKERKRVLAGSTRASGAA